MSPTNHPSSPNLSGLLSADIHLLGGLLGDIIREQHGADAFALVERVRASAKARRAGDPSALDDLVTTIDGLDTASLQVLIKAFSSYFQLINIAEDLQRIRVLRQREAEGCLRESLDAAVRALHEAGLDADAVRDLLDRLRVRLVLTAHPSEAKRKELLVKLRQVAVMMADRDRQSLLPRERIALEAALAEEIEELWQTRPTRAVRPTATDEVDFGLYFITSVIMDAVVDISGELRASLAAYYPGEDWAALPAALPAVLPPLLPPLLAYASWMGGDRDGNPNVTPQVTLDTLALLREAARRVYLADIAFLREHLTQSLDEVPVSSFLRFSLPRDGDLEARYPGELYRQKMDVIYQTLAANAYPTGQALLADLRLVVESLQQNRGGRVAAGALFRLVEKVRLFGLHLVPLEIRQDAQVHAAMLDTLFRRYGMNDAYLALPEDEKQALLTGVIENQRPFFPPEPDLDPQANDVIATWRMIAAAHDRYGPAVIDTAIVSRTEAPSDVLAMLLLATEVGVQDDLALVPLFETIDDLRQAPVVMRTLFANPAYRRYLAARGNHQQIMIGYSDSNKDGGYFSSNWSLYTAQETLAEACAAHDVCLELFHGRGGSIGRGGGPTNRAILANPPAAMQGPVKITEQGEVIAYRYSNAAITRRHLHQVMHAALLATGASQTVEVRQEWRDVMDALAEEGRAAYRTLVYETPGFLDYWQQATPIQQLSRLPIGSRPVKRAKGGFAAIRAIPWVFSWMQNRAIIPSWYGVGQALAAFCGEDDPECDGLPTLQAMYRDWPFFQALVDNVELDLAKADMGIAALYAALVADVDLRRRIFGRIEAEHARACRYVNRIIGQEVLLDHAPVLQHSIERRNPYVDPLNFIQVALLRALRRQDLASSERNTLLELVLATVNGIAAGMKTTG